MKTTVFPIVAFMLAGVLGAQERKPVPKDSIRVFVPGCSKGYVFTAGARTEDQPGGSAVPAGVHLRMNGPKKLMTEIKGQEGSKIEITGLIKKGQMGEDGIRIGPGVRVRAGTSSSGVGQLPDPSGGQLMIDVEGWRRVLGTCPAR